MDELISIIVPVYNVQNYLEDCIKSLINQTYKNIEIILIDDGSTDDSGMICDQYADLDSRIRVFHKKNGGLSDARNFGLNKAKGEYIGFVDSDDYVSLDMYRILYDLCKKNKTKIACARFDIFGDEIDYNTPKETGTYEIISAEEMLSTILLCGIDNKRFASISVWDRLYEKSVIKNLVFPVGKCFEDIVYSTKALLAAQNITYIDKCLYHYRIRKGSITNSIEKFNEKLLTDKLTLESEQLIFLSSLKLDKLVLLIKCNIFRDLFGIRNIVSSEYIDMYRKYIRLYCPSFFMIINVDYPIKEKIKLLIKVFIAKVKIK